MKKTILFSAAASMLLAFASCGNDEHIEEVSSDNYLVLNVTRASNDDDPYHGLPGDYFTRLYFFTADGKFVQAEMENPDKPAGSKITVPVSSEEGSNGLKPNTDYKVVMLSVPKDFGNGAVSATERTLPTISEVANNGWSYTTAMTGPFYSSQTHDDRDLQNGLYRKVLEVNTTVGAEDTAPIILQRQNGALVMEIYPDAFEYQSEFESITTAVVSVTGPEKMYFAELGENETPEGASYFDGVTTTGTVKYEKTYTTDNKASGGTSYLEVVDGKISLEVPCLPTANVAAFSISLKDADGTELVGGEYAPETDEYDLPIKRNVRTRASFGGSAAQKASRASGPVKLQLRRVTFEEMD